MKRSRDNRALKRKSTWGRVVAAGEWAGSEWGALRRLWELGVPVPYPVQIDETEIMMEWITHTVDGEVETAPRLAQVRPERALLESYYEQLRDALATMAQAGVVHGDLSPYNTLAAGDRLVIIDLPQIVDLVGNPRGHGLPAPRLRQHVPVVPGPRARGGRAGALRGPDGARVLSGGAGAVDGWLAGPVRHTHGRIVDITTLPDLDARLAAGARSLEGWRVVGLDLTERGSALLSRSVASALFLGCTFADGDEEEVRRRGAVVLPDLPGSPVDTYRTTLYSPARPLRHAPATRASLDARAYAWSQRRSDRERLQEEALARALHDHAIDQALTALDRRPADARRDGRPRARARLRRRTPTPPGSGTPVGAAVTVATGGGPGRHGGRQPRRPAVRVRRRRPRRGAGRRWPRCRPSRPDIGAWADAAPSRVVDAVADPVESLGIPTWHYGHEPPNPFATAIAKYFRNATREAVLLEVCTRGDRLPARRRRDRAGGLPGRLRELLRRRVLDRPDGARRARALDRRRCRPGRCSRRWPGDGRWRSTCTSSTPSPRRPTWWRRTADARSGLDGRALRLRRRAARRRRRSRGRGCRGRSSGCPWPRAGGRTRARPWGRWPSTSSPASG